MSTTTIETNGSTSLTASGNNFLLHNIGGVDISLKYAGAPVEAGQFAGWTPISAEHTTSVTYQVVWKADNADQYMVWATDNNGDYFSTTARMTGANPALEMFETLFQQDLNDDGTIGIPSTTTQAVIEANSRTSLIAVGNHFLLHNVAANVMLSYAGALVEVGQFGDWTLIGAERTVDGGQVVWKFGNTDQYKVWTIDNDGNYVSGTATMSGASTALQVYEIGLHQDLNGDGAIGVPPTTIEANGSTSLMAAGSTFLLHGSGADVSLKYAGAVVQAGQFGGWTPISAEQTASGYQVAWKFGNADQYTVWTTDSNGAHLSNTAVVSGASTTLKALEIGFRHDLNGDGTIGIPDKAVLSIGEDHDTFLFKPNFGQVTISHFAPETDIIEIDHNLFQSFDALLAATHDDLHGNAIITDAVNDTITIQNFSAALLQAHQDAFHLV